MLAIVLALASAISYGGSDFAAGLAARSVSVIQVTLVASAAALAAVAAAVPFAAAHPPQAAALAWGAAAGLGGTLGALALYLGFRHAAFSVAGPLSAVGTAGFSVLAGLLLGERPTALALAGIVLALPAIVGVSASAAVLTSLYPAVTIVLARALLGERLTRLRLAGLGLAAGCVALIAAGGAG
jgi:drug/metabolite transporter (DMT)-like permease